MTAEELRKHCLSLPHTTEEVQWGDHLLFKIGGKMFVVLSLTPGSNFASLKCTEQEFLELIERPGVIPAPYLARAHWIALERSDALPRAELKRLVSQGYELVKARLPKKVLASLGA